MEATYGIKNPTTDLIEIKKYFSYNPETGELRYSKNDPRNTKGGKLAGTTHPTKPPAVGFKKTIIKASRLIWALHYGEWPDAPIVHIDGNNHNLKIINLQKKFRYTEKQTITQEDVKALLDYNPETGEIKYKITTGSGKFKTGDIVEYKLTPGRNYRRITINNKQYFLHRIIWLWVYGYLPENLIDHKDRNPLNNRLSNLREVSNQCNIRNSKVCKTNKSKITGVCKSYGDKFEAYIKVNYKKKSLGHFKDFSEAVAHRLAAEQCLGWATCDDNSSACQFMRTYKELTVS